MTIYSCTKTQPTEFRFVKFSDDADILDKHFVQEFAPKQFHCDCMGFHHRSRCRHLEMLNRFLKEDKVGTYLYHYETAEFSAMPDAYCD